MTHLRSLITALTAGFVAVVGAMLGYIVAHSTRPVRAWILVALFVGAAPRIATCQSSYLFVWTGGAGTNDFMATIDANPSSKTYGRVLATAATGSAGMPHHTEQELGPNGHE